MPGDAEDPLPPRGWPRQRWWGALVSVVLAGLVAWPGVRLLVDGRDAADGYPLSTYPMFTTDRGRIVETPTVIALDSATDEVRRLSPSTIADTDQVIEAHNVVRRAIDRGETASAELCEQVAGRVRSGSASADGEPVLHVVLERYDGIAWAAGDDEPLERLVVASC